MTTDTTAALTAISAAAAKCPTIALVLGSGLGAHVVDDDAKVVQLSRPSLAFAIGRAQLELLC